MFPFWQSPKDLTPLNATETGSGGQRGVANIRDRGHSRWSVDLLLLLWFENDEVINDISNDRDRLNENNLR